MKMAHLEHDMVCLIDSFVYLKDDSYQQIQALDLLAEMCLHENGPDLMKKTKGLSTVLNMLLQKKVDINIFPNALYTLGNAVLHSESNKVFVWSEQLSSMLNERCLQQHCSAKLVVSASYFLACFCSNNENAQNKSRTSGCIERLVSLYKLHHPNGKMADNEVENWFETAISSSSAKILNHISHALRSAINKPVNGENQLICSRLLNLAVSSITCSETSEDCKKEALQFIADCAYENAKVQNILSMIGGIRYLIQFLENGVEKMSMSLKALTIDVICAAVADNASCKAIAGKEGVVNMLLTFLKQPFNNKLHLKCLICLSDMVYENEVCQRQVLELDGVPLVIDIMSKNQDELIAKIGTSVLQSCMTTLKDLEKTPCQEEKEDSQGSLDPISRILSFLPVGKSKASTSRTVSSKNKYVDARKLALKVLESQPCNNDQQAPDVAVDSANREIQGVNEQSSSNNIVSMLTEQKQLMQNFQDDINRLRTELTMSASQAGESDVSVISKPSSNVLPQTTRPQVKVTSDFNNANGVFKVPFPLTGTSETPVHGRRDSQTPVHGRRNLQTPVHERRGGSVSQTTPSRQMHGANRFIPENDNLSFSSRYPYEADERPALSRMFSQPIAQDTSSEYMNNVSMRQASLIEKVEKWRQSFTHNDSYSENSDALDETDIPAPPSYPGKVHSTPAPPDQWHNSSYVRTIENAPSKKKHSMKRRRESTLDEIMFIPITPENYKLLGCHAKRTLNFPNIIQHSDTSGFIDYESTRDDIRSSKTCRKNREMKKCIGCSPFNSISLLRQYNSRNLLSLLETENITCRYHKELAITFGNSACNENSTVVSHTPGRKSPRKSLFIVQSPTKSQLYNQRDVLRPVLRPINKQFDNMSVFSFRSRRSKSYKELDDDNMSSISKWTSVTNMSSRRVRQDYTDDEIMYIFQGIERYGTRWTVIRNRFPFNPIRTSIDLSDKYKRMKRRGIVGDAKNSFTSGELIDLQTGVKKYGNDWRKILECYEFKPFRNQTDLKIKWLSLNHPPIKH